MSKALASPENPWALVLCYLETGADGTDGTFESSEQEGLSEAAGLALVQTRWQAALEFLELKSFFHPLAKGSFQALQGSLGRFVSSAVTTVAPYCLCYFYSSVTCWHTSYKDDRIYYFKGLRPWAGSAGRSAGRAVSKHFEAPKLP